MTQDRRTFLTTVGLATLGVSARRALAQFEGIEREHLKRVGIQLYSVRKEAAADLGGTLERLAKIGYKEVEFAGYHNHSATEVRDFLKHTGLAAPSAHIPIDQIENNAAQTFADAKTVGLKWITVPSLPQGKHETADDWKRVAAQFNAAATKAKAAGFRFAFHNHNDIVRKTGDVLPVEILMKETDPALVSYEMDLYWAVNGGADPVALLAKYPGRFKMFHVKDGPAPYETQTDVGKGAIDFKTIFAKAKGKGIEHYFVESDNPADPMAFAAASHKYLAKLAF